MEWYSIGLGANGCALEFGSLINLVVHWSCMESTMCLLCATNMLYGDELRE